MGMVHGKGGQETPKPSAQQTVGDSTELQVGGFYKTRSVFKKHPYAKENHILS